MGSAELGGSGEHRSGQYDVADLMKSPAVASWKFAEIKLQSCVVRAVWRGWGLGRTADRAVMCIQCPLSTRH